MSGRLPGKVTTPKAEGKTKQSVNRGTQDEMEIVGLIVMANAGVRTLVFDRLRQAKARHMTRQEILSKRGNADD